MSHQILNLPPKFWISGQNFEFLNFSPNFLIYHQNLNCALLRELRMTFWWRYVTNWFSHHRRPIRSTGGLFKRPKSIGRNVATSKWMKRSGARQCPLATHGHNDQIYTFSPPFSAFGRKERMIYVVWSGASLSFYNVLPKIESCRNKTNTQNEFK